MPKLVQDRVKLWMEFSWEQEKNMDEQKLLSFLPGKMKTDIALRVDFFFWSSTTILDRHVYWTGVLLCTNGVLLMYYRCTTIPMC